MVTRRRVLAALATVSAAPAGVHATQSTASTGAGSRPELKIGIRQKLLMVGDSITDAGRARPVGEGPGGDGVGRGYVAFVEAWLSAVYPERWIRIVNQGISGNTTRDLKNRWQTDVLDLKPDWVSIMIGANDVWRQFDSTRQVERHVPLDEYEKNLNELVLATQPLVKGLVVMTPFYLEKNRQDPMRAMMDTYGAAVKRLATTHGALFVDTQAAFDKLLEVYYPAMINWDRVHLNATGNTVVARAFLDGIGFDWLR